MSWVSVGGRQGHENISLGSGAKRKGHLSYGQQRLSIVIHFLTILTRAARVAFSDWHLRKCSHIWEHCKGMFQFHAYSDGVWKGHQ